MLTGMEMEKQTMTDPLTYPEKKTEAMGGHKRESVSPRGAGGDVWSSIKKTLVLLTSSCVVLLALRNTITFHLQHFWGASGDFWQHQWDRILELHDNDNYKVLAYGPTLASYILYWTIGSVFTIMDWTNFPYFIRPYKTQPGTNEPITLRVILKTFLYVTFSQLVAGIPFAMMAYHLMVFRGYDESPLLPTFHWVLFELAVSIIVIEISFYYSHRLCHHRYLYKYIHKIHHEWQSPIAIAALYAHPIEYLFTNVAPVMLGPLILGSHPATLMLWTCLATLNTLNAHCGYHLPFFPSNEAHDYHHLKFNQCYGVLGILDHLHGTDDKFRASSCYPRHTTILSFIPPRQLFPDVDPNAKNIKGKNC